MAGPIGGRDKQSFDGEAVASETVWDSMQAHASERPNTEVGGMLFGEFVRNRHSEIEELRIERVVNVPPEHSVSERTFFSIDSDFMSDVVDEYTPKYTYLGNWHSHLGYGGPSSGDYNQVKEFFERNGGRNLLIAIIQDLEGSAHNPSYTQHIEIYRRKKPESTAYDILRVSQVSLIEHPPEREQQDQQETESLAEKLIETAANLDINKTLRSDVCHLVNSLSERGVLDASGNGAIYTKTGMFNEIVALLPIKVAIKSSSDNESTSGVSERVKETGRAVSSRMQGFQIPVREEQSSPLTSSSPESKESTKECVEALLSISVPANYPEGEIYIDVKSRDQTVQATVRTVESRALQNDYERIAALIEKLLEEDIPDVLTKEFAALLSDATPATEENQ